MIGQTTPTTAPEFSVPEVHVPPAVTELAATGSSLEGLVVIGLVLLLIGAAFVVRSRRARAHG